MSEAKDYEAYGRELAQLMEEAREKDAEIEKLKATIEHIDDHGRALESFEIINAQKSVIEQQAKDLDMFRKLLVDLNREIQRLHQYVNIGPGIE